MHNRAISRKDCNFRFLAARRRCRADSASFLKKFILSSKEVVMIVPKAFKEVAAGMKEVEEVVGMDREGEVMGEGGDREGEEVSSEE
jgi:hypothetical protein